MRHVGISFSFSVWRGSGQTDNPCQTVKPDRNQRSVSVTLSQTYEIRRRLTRVMVPDAFCNWRRFVKRMFHGPGFPNRDASFDRQDRQPFFGCSCRMKPSLPASSPLPFMNVRRAKLARGYSACGRSAEATPRQGRTDSAKRRPPYPRLPLSRIAASGGTRLGLFRHAAYSDDPVFCLFASGARFRRPRRLRHPPNSRFGSGATHRSAPGARRPKNCAHRISRTTRRISPIASLQASGWRNRRTDLTPGVKVSFIARALGVARGTKVLALADKAFRRG